MTMKIRKLNKELNLKKKATQRFIRIASYSSASLFEKFHARFSFLLHSLSKYIYQIYDIILLSIKKLHIIKCYGKKVEINKKKIRGSLLFCLKGRTLFKTRYRGLFFKVSCRLSWYG